MGACCSGGGGGSKPGGAHADRSAYGVSGSAPGALDWDEVIGRRRQSAKVAAAARPEGSANNNDDDCQVPQTVDCPQASTHNAADSEAVPECSGGGPENGSPAQEAGIAQCGTGCATRPNADGRQVEAAGRAEETTPTHGGSQSSEAESPVDKDRIRPLATPCRRVLYSLDASIDGLEQMVERSSGRLKRHYSHNTQMWLRQLRNADA